MDGTKRVLGAVVAAAALILGTPAVASAASYRYDRQWTFAGKTDDIAGVAVSRGGSVFVVGEKQRMRRYSPSGKLQRTWQLDFTPADVAVAPDGRVHVLQNWNWQNGTTWVKVLAADGTVASQYTLGEDVDWFPEQIAIDQRGNAFIVDTNDDQHALHWFDASGAYRASINSALDLPLDDPAGVTVAASGDVFVSDTGNNRIVQFKPNADGSGFAVIRQWGQSGLRNGQFMSPHSLATARNGNILVLDVHSRRLQEFTPGGKFVRVIGRRQLRENADVAVSRRGDIYVGGYLESLRRGVARFTRR